MKKSAIISVFFNLCMTLNNLSKSDCTTPLTIEHLKSGKEEESGDKSPFATEEFMCYA